MPTLTGTLAEITGSPIDPDSLHEVTVRAPSSRASLGDQSRLVASVAVPVEVSAGGVISVDLEPGPAVLLVQGEGFRDTYELGVTEDMTLLTEAIAESAPSRSWVESNMVQLRAQALAAAGLAELSKIAAGTAAADAEAAKVYIDGIRDVLDEAAQTNVAPYLTETALKATYGLPTGVEVRKYGAVGDGTTDDAPAIRAALAAAPPGSRVIGRPGDTYRLATAVTQTLRTASGGTLSAPVALTIPNGVTLDLSTSTVLLDADAVVVANSGALAANPATTGGGCHLNIDGNNAAPGRWLTHLCKTQAWTLDITAHKVVTGGVYVFDAEGIESTRLHVDGCAGQPFTIGTYTENRTGTVRHSTFGSITARNVTVGATNPYNFPGNAFYGELANSTIDRIAGVDCTAGIKLGASSDDVTVGRIDALRCGDSINNSGIKLQGDFPGVTDGPRRVNVGVATARGCTSHGLYLHNTIDCTVTAYVGEGNVTGGDGHDVWISGTRDTVGTLKSTNSGGVGVLVRAAAKDFRLGTTVIRNAGKLLGASATGSMAFNTEAGARGSITSLTVIDDQTTPTTQRGININSTAVVSIGHAEARGMTVPLNLSGVGSAAMSPRIGADLPMGEVTLTAAATSTPIANSNFFLWGAAHTPIIELVRVNSSARALGSLYWRCTASGGFTLHHSAAAGGEIIQWRLVGYRSGGTSPT